MLNIYIFIYKQQNPPSIQCEYKHTIYWLCFHQPIPGHITINVGLRANRQLGITLSCDRSRGGSFAQQVSIILRIRTGI